MVLCQVNDAQCHFGEDGMRRFHPLVFFAAKAALDHVARDNRSAVAARPRADDGDGTAGRFQPTRHPGRTGHVERMFCLDWLFRRRRLRRSVLVLGYHVVVLFLFNFYCVLYDNIGIR